MVVDGLRDPVGYPAPVLVRGEARGYLVPPAAVGGPDGPQQVVAGSLELLGHPLHEGECRSVVGVAVVAEELLQARVGLPEPRVEPDAAEEHVVVVLELAGRLVRVRPVGDPVRAAEEQRPFRLHEVAFHRALLRGEVHGPGPEAVDRGGELLDGVEEVDDVDGLREVIRLHGGVGVVHVGDEILRVPPLLLGDPAEVLPEVGHLPGADDVDHLAGLEVVQDAGVLLVLVLGVLHLVDAEDPGQRPPRHGAEEGVEQADRVGLRDPVAVGDLLERQGLQEVVPDRLKLLLGHGGVPRDP